eukprot:14625_1
MKQKQCQGYSDQTVSSEKINGEILISCLDSLHCYLLHDNNTLYRLRNDDNASANIRFSTQTNPLQFADEFDEFINFMWQNMKVKDVKFITNFTEWLTAENYDWDSLFGDIDCETKQKGKQPNQSNVYLFLVRKKQTQLFDLFYQKYMVQHRNIDAINFGISVLNWFEYGD